MGTRCLTFVYEKYGEVEKPVVNMYRQFDGYPEGHGAELSEFLNSDLSANGMGCLAAQMVAHFKESPGGFYIHPTDVTECGQDYEYHIYGNDKGFYIDVYNCGCNFFGVSSDEEPDLIFRGNLKEFTEFCEQKETA
jgi:hypothetical protein